jgi:protein Tex
VRVKVLDVDVPRKRISLTLRLDDDAASIAAPKRGGAPASRPQRPSGAGPRAAGGAGAAGGGAGEARGGAARGRDNRRGRDDAPLANTALADALRRAGLDGTSDKETGRR